VGLKEINNEIEAPDYRLSGQLSYQEENR